MVLESVKPLIYYPYIRSKIGSGMGSVPGFASGQQCWDACSDFRDRNIKFGSDRKSANRDS